MRYTYRVEYTTTGTGYHTPQGWDSRHYGRPTDKSLARWAADLEGSTAPGGVNAHLGQLTVRAARVVRQAGGETVASYAA